MSGEPIEEEGETAPMLDDVAGGAMDETASDDVEATTVFDVEAVGATVESRDGLG